MTARTPARVRVLVAALAVLVLAAAAIVVAVWQRGSAPDAASAPQETTPVATARPSPTPTPTGPPPDTTAYDLADLLSAQVFSVNPAVPLDDAPDAATTGLVAQAKGAAPVFAEPGGEPVAVLPREQQHGGVVVPIVAREEHWVQVLLAGRQGVPPEGSSAQTAGWLRVTDVDIVENPHVVEVSLSAGTIDIVTGGRRERIADRFAWGTDATPTPLGRSFIMTTAVTEYAYTRGHPIVYLSVQSPTLAGFDGADVAVTAFHYHDVREGPISNGCIRVDPDAITRLASLPAGTPVHIAA